MSTGCHAVITLAIFNICCLPQCRGVYCIASLLSNLSSNDVAWLLLESAATLHDRSDDTGELVGDRNGYDTRGSPCQQCVDPPGQVRLVTRVANNGDSAEHEEPSQVRFALLGDAAQYHLPRLLFCCGTSHIEAAKWRPDLDALALTTVATSGVVVMTPTPEIVASAGSVHSHGDGPANAHAATGHEALGDLGKDRDPSADISWKLDNITQLKAELTFYRLDARAADA